MVNMIYFIDNRTTYIEENLSESTTIIIGCLFYITSNSSL